MLMTVEINKKVEKREKMRAEYRKKYKELKLLLKRNITNVARNLSCRKWMVYQ